MGLIDVLRKKREELLAAEARRKLLYEENDVYEFYEESLSFSHATDGRVHLITPDEVLAGKAPKGLSHRKVCEDLLERKYQRDVDLGRVEGDYGYYIAEEFNTIFIRMVSIINNVSVIYYPKEVNEFQIRELKRFKEQLDEFNALHKKGEQAEILYIDSEGNESKDLDALINYLESKAKKDVK